MEGKEIKTDKHTATIPMDEYKELLRVFSEYSKIDANLKAHLGLLDYRLNMKFSNMDILKEPTDVNLNTVFNERSKEFYFSY